VQRAKGWVVQPNSRTRQILWTLSTAWLLLGIGCGDGANGDVLYVDAEYDPALPSDTSASVTEVSLAVAQTFTVLEDGKFERFDIVLTQGAANSEGVVRIDVRPTLVTGEPEIDDTNSIIDPIDVNTVDLPGTLIDEFTIFDVGDDPGRQVLAGEVYAIVVTFVSRTGGNVDDPMALLLGRTGDEYLEGSGSLDPDGMGFTNNAFDYFFRTYSLR
jgi:hypothetical protein